MASRVPALGPVDFDQSSFRTVMGHFASGVVILTAATGEGPVGMTCQSFVSLSLDPPLVAISPSRTSTTWPRIREAGHFCANVLSHEQQTIGRAFAVSGGDKYGEVRWDPAPSTKAPVLEGSLAWIDCTIRDVHEAGDHYLVVADVVGIEARQGQPLLFYRGGFGTFLA